MHQLYIRRARIAATGMNGRFDLYDKSNNPSSG